MTGPQERGGATGSVDLEAIRARFIDYLAVAADPYEASNDMYDLLAEVERLRGQFAERDATIEDLSVRLTQAEMAVTNDWSYLDRVYNVVDAAKDYASGHQYACRFEYRYCTCGYDDFAKALAALDQPHRSHHAVDAHTEGTQGTEQT